MACPTCGTQVVWTADSRWRPFCSERCKTVDLGAWAAERYAIAADDADPSPRDESDDLTR